MSQWYFSYEGQQEGPYDQAQAVAKAQANPNGHAWRNGFAEWLPITKIAELKSGGAAAAGPATPPPSTRVSADEIDYVIEGTEMQFVEIELDPGESVIAEAGSMMYKNPAIAMDAVFGDGSGQNAGKGFMGKVLGAGKRLLTGEGLFMTLFTHQGQGKARAAFGAPYPGNIIPITLANRGNLLICQKDCFLCAARGVAIGIHFQKKILTGLFGGEGFIMQKLEGDGLAFLHAGGTIVERELQPGETLHVDTGCVVAYEGTVDMDVQRAGNIKTSLFGGEGLFFAALTGPGHVWLQSLPFSRLAGRMLQAAPQRGGSVGEGSILGGIGNLLDGDN